MFRLCKIIRLSRQVAYVAPSLSLMGTLSSVDMYKVHDIKLVLKHLLLLMNKFIWKPDCIAWPVSMLANLASYRVT